MTSNPGISRSAPISQPRYQSGCAPFVARAVSYGTGLLLLGLGLAYLTEVSVGGSYFGDLFPGFLLIGVGIGFSFVPISIAALGGISPSEAGLASGLINTSQQIGGALGLAVLVTVATSRTDGLVAGGTQRSTALTDGFTTAFWVAVAFAALSLVATLVVIRRRDVAQIDSQLADAP